MPQLNAGLRLWEVQKSQGTGLCIGLDPHYEPDGQLNKDFYNLFAFGKQADNVLSQLSGVDPKSYNFEATNFLSGVYSYFRLVIDVALELGLRLFKPQAAFFELLHPFAGQLLSSLCHHLESKHGMFKILDAKKGDIDSTQKPYFTTYLTPIDQEVIPGVKGSFGFDAMTVTTWMGEDVLTPGLPFFKQGKGAVVVTRTSNPSGTTLQDAYIMPNPGIELTAKQLPFQFTGEVYNEIRSLLRRQPMVHEVMLFLTERFSISRGLNQEGVSPIFSVMGSTVKMLDSFRKIRPGGIALIPGFGAQGGQFANIMPLAIEHGPLAGHVGILSSSREHNYPWMKKYGGQGDPRNLKFEMERVVTEFRNQEKAAYAKAGIDYPF